MSAAGPLPFPTITGVWEWRIGGEGEDRRHIISSYIERKPECDGTKNERRRGSNFQYRDNDRNEFRLSLYRKYTIANRGPGGYKIESPFYDTKVYSSSGP
jgi:hypothetical protein